MYYTFTYKTLNQAFHLSAILKFSESLFSWLDRTSYRFHRKWRVRKGLNLTVLNLLCALMQSIFTALHVPHPPVCKWARLHTVNEYFGMMCSLTTDLCHFDRKQLKFWQSQFVCEHDRCYDVCPKTNEKEDKKRWHEACEMARIC